MNNPVLMNIQEPSDNELLQLMNEVAVEAKKRALKTQQQLAEKVKQLIAHANEKNETVSLQVESKTN